jgi:hypothetical protein
LIAATAATGCTTEDAHVGATWTIRTLSNPDIGCPPGFDTAALYNQPVDLDGTPVGQPIIDLFDCADGFGTSAPLPPDTYETWIEITDTNNTQQYAQSTPAFLDVTSTDLTYSAEIFDDAGYFQLQWDLVGANSQAPLTCADAGIADPNSSGVEINSTLSGTTAAATDQFNCTDHFGITAALAAGDYTVSIDAFTDAQGAIGEPVNIPTATIGDHNQITDLGSVMLPIDGL